VADEVTNAELARRLERVHDDISGISHRLDQYVLREVYRAEMEGRDTRLGALEQRVREGEDQRRALVRWVIGAVVVPTVVLLAQIVLALRGPT
jgi:ribosomal protein S28E/S33